MSIYLPANRLLAVGSHTASSLTRSAGIGQCNGTIDLCTPAERLYVTNRIKSVKRAMGRTTERV